MNRGARTSRHDRERGQTMAEYAMVISIITLAILLSIVAIGDSAGGLIDRLVALIS